MMRAFGAAKVVITSDVPQVREYDSTFCWRLPTDPAQEQLQLFERLLYAITHLDDVRAAGISALNYVQANATWSAVTQKYEEVIHNEIMDNKHNSWPGTIDVQPEIGINLIGDLTAASGLSEATCNTLDALLQCGVPVSYTELRYEYSKRSLNLMNPAYQSLFRERIYPINLMFYNINEFHCLTPEQLAALTDGKYTIAFWFWELSEIPVDYQRQLNRIDEIWVSSQFTQASMLTVAQVPVTVIPVPVEVKVPPR